MVSGSLSKDLPQTISPIMGRSNRLPSVRLPPMLIRQGTANKPTCHWRQGQMLQLWRNSAPLGWMTDLTATRVVEYFVFTFLDRQNENLCSFDINFWMWNLHFKHQKASWSQPNFLWERTMGDLDKCLGHHLNTKYLSSFDLCCYLNRTVTWYVIRLGFKNTSPSFALTLTESLD
jgi:hypothetical protein